MVTKYALLEKICSMDSILLLFSKIEENVEFANIKTDVHKSFKYSIGYSEPAC